MADQRIVDLPIKNDTAISLADYLMGIDASEGYQMLISDLAKKIIETYAGTSLAGSTNTLKSAIDSINNDLNFLTEQYSYTYDGTISAGSTFNIKGSDFGISYPSGYTPIAITRVGASTGSLVLVGFNVRALTSNACALKNISSGDVENPTVTIGILYAKTSIVNNN